MANRIWIGPATGDSNNWFIVDNWQTSPPDPPNYPQPGDTVTIAIGGPSINPGDPSALYDEIVTLGSDSRSAPAIITTTVGVTLGGNFNLQSIGTSAYATLELSGTTVFNGTILASVRYGAFEINKQADAQGALVFVIGTTGSITAQNGHTISFSGGTMTNDGRLAALGGSLNLAPTTLHGSGEILLGLGGTLTIGAPVLPSQTLRFRDPNGFLYLSDPASFAARITGFQPGNVIVLAGILANEVSYDPAGEVLTISDQGSPVARLSLSGSGSRLQFHTKFDRFGGTIITSSDATRTWNGGMADWFAPGNWTTSAPDPPNFPLSGDRVRITSGTATITVADVAQYGTLDVERITLASTDAASPATLSVSSLTLGLNVVIEAIGDRAFGRVRSFGTTTFSGLINASTRHGRLIIAAESDGSTPTFVNTDNGSIIAAPEARIDFTAGTIENQGIVLAQGAVSVGSGATFSGSGEIRIQQGGHVLIEGVFDADQYVEFGDSTGILKLANLPGFAGYVSNFSEGDRIELTNLAVNSVQCANNTLQLFYDATPVGSLQIYTIDGGSDFQVRPRGDGGSLITYTSAIRILQPALPVPVVAQPGGSVSLQDLLMQAFGTIPAEFASYGLSTLGAKDLRTYDWSYWNLTNPQPSGWSVNGIPVRPLPVNTFIPPTKPTLEVTPGDMGSVQYLAGNNIGPETMLTIRTGGTVDNPTENTTYFLITIDPAMLSPNAYSGRVEPADIVATAKRFAAFYQNVPNNNDCWAIADAVAAASGASMPNLNASTDPSANVSGGFWRVVYRGSDQVNPVRDWSTLVQPGDIVRMAWEGGDDGQHTTTVVVKNPDGTLEVYDNWDPVIELHPAAYWQDTLPESITIYRLDPDHQYLIEGTKLAEIIQGSVFNNLIRPGGGQDKIANGPEANEIQDITAYLNGITVTNFHLGDTLNFTDLDNSGVIVAFAGGVLTVSRGAVSVAKINLPDLSAGASFVTRPNGRGGTLVLLSPGM